MSERKKEEVSKYNTLRNSAEDNIIRNNYLFYADLYVVAGTIMVAHTFPLSTL